MNMNSFFRYLILITLVSCQDSGSSSPPPATKPNTAKKTEDSDRVKELEKKLAEEKKANTEESKRSGEDNDKEKEEKKRTKKEEKSRLLAAKKEEMSTLQQVCQTKVQQQTSYANMRNQVDIEDIRRYDNGENLGAVLSGVGALGQAGWFAGVLGGAVGTADWIMDMVGDDDQEESVASARKLVSQREVQLGSDIQNCFSRLDSLRGELRGMIEVDSNGDDDDI